MTQSRTRADRPPRRTARPRSPRRSRSVSVCRARRAWPKTLERLRWIEIGAGNVDPACNKLGEKARPHAGRLEMTLDCTVGGGAGTHVFVDVLHLQDVALKAGDFGDRRHLALAVGE